MKNIFVVNEATKAQILNECKKLYNALVNGNGNDSICIDRRNFQITDFCGAFGREDLSIYQIPLAYCYSDPDNDSEDMYSWEEIEKQIISKLEYYADKPIWFTPHMGSFNLFMNAYHSGNYDYAHSVLKHNQLYWRGEEVHEAHKLMNKIADF